MAMDQEAFQIAITMKTAKRASHPDGETRLQLFKHNRELICKMELYRDSTVFWKKSHRKVAAHTILTMGNTLCRSLRQLLRRHW